MSLTTGSFLNNLISSFEKGIKPDLFRSFCMCGEKTLAVKDLIPVVSYISIKGKCRYCSRSLSVRYFLVEAVSGLAGILSYIKFGLSPEYFIYFSMLAILITISAIDYSSYLIPNSLVFVLLILAVIKNFIYLQTGLILYNVITALVFIVSFVLLNMAAVKFKNKEVIGFGDIKLLAVLFLFIDIPLSLIGLWISALIAIPGFYLLKQYTDRFKNSIKVPFGFFIGIGYAITVLLGDNILLFYYSILGL